MGFSDAVGPLFALTRDQFRLSNFASDGPVGILDSMGRSTPNCHCLRCTELFEKLRVSDRQYACANSVA
jgi:hypothetical protein